MAERSEQVIVAGAGVVGVSTAFMLARAGYPVTVVERRAAPGLGTSAENGAQLSYGFADPISTPAVLRRLPAILSGRDPGISVHVPYLVSHPMWSLRFLRNCMSARSLDNTRVLTRLALRSMNLMTTWGKETGVEFCHARTGRLVLYDNPASLAAAAAAAEERRSQGARLEALGPDGCLAVEPALESWTDPVAGGIHAPDDEVGDAAEFCRNMAAYCEDHLGVRFCFDAELTGVQLDGKRVAAVSVAGETLPAGQLIICTGVWSARLQSALGLRIPVLPLKGYSLTLPAETASPKGSIASARHRVVFARLGERVRIAGLAHVRGFDTRTFQKHVELIFKRARALFPGAGNYDQLLSSWSGLRPLTPDGLPLIGATHLDNLWLNTGHGGLGWTLAAGSAEFLLHAIEGGAEPRFHRGVSAAGGAEDDFDVASMA